MQTVSRRKSRGFWELKQNQRNFLDGIAYQFQIKEPKQWGTIRTQDIMKSKGVSLILKYDGSIFETLKTVYPGKLQNKLCNVRNRLEKGMV